MNIIKKPYYWVSAHRDIDFTFEYQNTYPLTAVVGNGGFAVFIFTGDGINSVAVGGYIYVDTAPYKGYHKVTEHIFSNWYKTETTYIGNGTGELTFISSSVFEIYKGYQSGDLAALLPYTKIAEFAPEPNLQGQLEVDISGYVNKIFDVINSNDTTEIGSEIVWYNLFNRIEILIDGVSVSTHMALNSAITSLELNRDYIDTGRSLNGGVLGNHYFSCGDSVEIIVSGSQVVTGAIYDGGTDETLVLVFKENDFDNSDFVTG